MSKLTAASLILIGSLTAAAGVSPGSAQMPQADMAPMATLPNTRVHALHSRINGRAYLIQVALPSAYVDAQPGDVTRYPTLYLLNGNLDFPLLFSLMQFASLVGPTNLILVGVAAADSQKQRRSFDYTPPYTAADSAWADSAWGGFRGQPGGGARQFLSVLKEEVIPLIDSSYRTSGDRGIEGSSLGGLFVAYAMLEEPDLFTRYAMVSPSLWFPFAERDKKLILDREPEFARQHPTFPKTVFVSVGSEEDPEMIIVAQRFLAQLCESLREGHYRGLDLASEIVAGQGHASVVARLNVPGVLYSADTARIGPRRAAWRQCR